MQRFINEIAEDEPDPAAAAALQEGLGGQFGEMRTMMQYLFQAMNFRGPAGKPYRDLIQGIGIEEISHVELIGTTISRLLDGSPAYQGKPTDPVDQPGAGGATPLSIALSEVNTHHYLVAAQGAMPVDAAGNPWNGSWVYNSGNLVLDLLCNLMLESKQFSFDLAGQSEAGRIFQGMSPSNDGTELDATQQAPEGVPSTIAPERFEEFSPGLDTDLLALIQATAEMELADIDATFGPLKWRHRPAGGNGPGW